MENNKIQFKNYILKIIGVFESKLDSKLKNKLNKVGYKQNQINSKITDDELKDYRSFIKNMWYPDFRNLFFYSDQEKSAKIYFLEKEHELYFEKGNEKNKIEFKVTGSELFYFSNELNLFTVDIKLTDLTLQNFSDLSNAIRNFETKILKETKWVDWIEQNILCGLEISSKPKKPTAKVDDYSGNKFKLFMVLDIEKKENDIDELLYEVGSVARIGSAKGTDVFAPSNEYYEEILDNKISVFKNWSALPLFDTFTAIGSNFLINENQVKTWKESYLRIYLYNLFLKYSLFKYNSEINDDTVKLRDKFIDFINDYYFSHISYNFLPNMILNKSRVGLEIEQELKQLQERIDKISQKIIEDKQSRTNLLITIITVLTSASSVIPIWNNVEEARTWSGMNIYLFYILLFMIVIAGGLAILAYIFPKKFKKIFSKWNLKKN